MLTEAQEKYLQTIPESKIVKINPWDQRTREIAKKIVSSIKSAGINLDILFMGAAALEISGQNDIDIYVISRVSDFEKYLPILKSLFGEPTKVAPRFIEWQWKEEGYDVELYLDDYESPSTQEQVKIFNLLKNNSELREEYKEIKETSDGLPFREYQRRKYEFYNRISRSEK